MRLLLQVRPAPAVPDDIQQQYDALQQCMLVLRSAHMSGKPDQPVKALAAAGLLDMEHVAYRDVLTDFSGIDSWLQYMEGGCVCCCFGYTCPHHKCVAPSWFDAPAYFDCPVEFDCSTNCVGAI